MVRANVAMTFAALGVLLALPGCRPLSDRSGGSTDVMATDQDFGTTKQLKVGQTLDLAIPDNPSTGYSWHYDWQPKAALRMLAVNDVGPSSHKPGSGSTQHLRFVGEQAGSVTITLQHGRWWKGGDREPEVKLTVQVTQ